MKISQSEINAVLGYEARNSILNFAKYVWPYPSQPFIEGYHTKIICNAIDRAINDYKNGKSTHLIIKTPFRHGKLLANETPILTTNGWKTHGELSVGDYVYGRHGQPVMVLAVSNEQECDNEISFSDGSKIVAHDSHEWFVYDRNKKSYAIKETRDIYPKRTKKYSRPRFLVDSNVCLDFEEKNLKIDPYVFGAWLGDGATSKNCITMHPDDYPYVVSEFFNCGYIDNSLIFHKDTGIATIYFRKLYRDLKSCGFLGNKFVPDEYIFCSKTQRLRLLAGLIDTDGYVNKCDGRVRIVNTNYKIIKAVKTIVNSLGKRVTITETEPELSSSGIQGKKKVYQIAFIAPFDIPTKIPRKGVIIYGTKPRMRGIVDIKKCDKHFGKCIQVDGGIYLAGETFVPTHNSQLISIMLPAYFLGLFPDNQVIATGYSYELMKTFSKEAREIVRDPKYRHVFRKKLSKDSAAIDEWGLEGHRGLVHYVGLGGSLAGRGGNLVLADDFFKNMQEAESEVGRENVWNAITSDLLSRAMEPRIVILVATPRHPDGPFGRIEKRMKEDINFPRFREIKLPAMSDKYETGTLFPEKYSKEWYLNQKATLGQYQFACLMQCDPVLLGGNLFKIDNIKYYEDDDRPTDVVWTRGWDLASTEKQRISDDPDYTVGLKLGVKWIPSNMAGEMRPILYVDDIIREQWDAPKRDRVIQDTAISDGPAVQTGIESHGQYKDTVKNIEEALKGIKTVKGVRLEGDKVSKWSRLEAPFMAGNVWLRKAPWNDAFLEEMRQVPLSAHDDQADALTIAFALHNPHLRTVWDYQITKTKPLDIHWEEANERNSVHISGMFYSKAFELYWLACLWDDVMGNLYVYDAEKWENFVPRLVVAQLEKRLQLKKYLLDGIYCNKEMFSSKANERTVAQLIDDEFFDRKLHARLYRPIRYDEHGAIVAGNALCKSNRLVIDYSLGDVARQFSNWVIDNGKPSDVDCGYCRTMCNILNELDRRGTFEKKRKKNIGYGRYIYE